MPRLIADGALSDADPTRLRELARDAAERCRRQLTETDPGVFSVTWNGQVHRAEVTAAEFEAQAQPLLARLRDPVLRSLRDSGIRVDSLSEVVLVGGGTRMPIVRKTITRMFGRFPNSSVHPDHAVALGAAVQAGLRSRDQALDEIRLTDVCPFTLGVDQAVDDGRGGFRTGVFSPIIERNTPIPASRVNSYVTVSDNQQVVEFGIYQGEAREVRQNVRLGELKVPVPRAKAGQVSVECRFSYDTSGLLEVDVHVLQTGMKKNLVILDEEDEVSPAEVEKRRAALAALKVHPRDDAANAAALARAARAYEAFIGDARDAIGAWIVQFEAVLDGQDPRRIEEARSRLVEALDQLEGERYL
jgi:molecular chaperone HscC